jgi:hypothetical protein
MRKLITGFGVVLILLTFAIAQTPYSNKFFSVNFPAGGYDFSTTDARSKDGLPITANVWSVTTSRTEYLVSYTDFPTARNPEEIPYVIDGEFQGLAKPEYTKTAAFVGDLEGSSGAGFGTDARNRMLYVYTRAALSADNKRLWQLEIMSGIPVSPEQTKSFFDSVVIK